MKRRRITNRRSRRTRIGQTAFEVVEERAAAASLTLPPVDADLPNPLVQDSESLMTSDLNTSSDIHGVSLDAYLDAAGQQDPVRPDVTFNGSAVSKFADSADEEAPQPQVQVSEDTLVSPSDELLGSLFTVDLEPLQAPTNLPSMNAAPTENHGGPSGIGRGSSPLGVSPFQESRPGQDVAQPTPHAPTADADSPSPGSDGAPSGVTPGTDSDVGGVGTPAPSGDVVVDTPDQTTPDATPDGIPDGPSHGSDSPDNDIQLPGDLEGTVQDLSTSPCDAGGLHEAPREDLPDGLPDTLPPTDGPSTPDLPPVNEGPDTDRPTDTLPGGVPDVVGDVVGDVTQDGRFSSEDIVRVFQAGKYGTGRAATRMQGDWNGDGLFDSRDFVQAFTHGRYEVPAAISGDDLGSGTLNPMVTDQSTNGPVVGSGTVELFHDLSQDDNVALAEEYLARFEVAGLEDLGQIEACQVTETIMPGIHILSDNPDELLTKVNAPLDDILPLPQNPSGPQVGTTNMTFSYTGLNGTAPTYRSSHTDTKASVVRFEDDELYDRALIIADTVVFDDAVLTLNTSVRELIIIARNVKTYGDAEIRWELSDTSAESIPDFEQAEDGRSNSTNQVPSGDKDGGWGAFGRGGLDGNDGYETHSLGETRGAPTISFYVDTFEMGADGHVDIPELDLSGQNGGRGQNGQDGGDGGDGGKGDPGVAWHLGPLNVFCGTPAGVGGDGGGGGWGGIGGNGGDGGQGGNVNLYYVDMPETVSVDTSEIDIEGGRGGAPGDEGKGGKGGDGGEGGNSGEWPCRDRSDDPDYQGADGPDGLDAYDDPFLASFAGTRGERGEDGLLTVKRISRSEWIDAFTSPYLVYVPESATVGDSIIIETYNVTGAATLNAIDADTDELEAFSLTEIAPDRYQWDIPLEMTSGIYEVLIARHSDFEVSELQFAIEIQPLITGVQFADEFDAIPGGTAYYTGYGLRSDANIAYDFDGDGLYESDGERTWWFETEFCDYETEACSVDFGMDWISFTIPNLPTDGELFQHGDGLTDHTVQLEQASPLQDPAEVSVRLKRYDGLTFRPSLNGYQFSNATMADSAGDHIAITIGQGSPFGVEFQDAYDLFKSSYGSAEVNALGGLFNPTVWANFGLWYAWWINPASATCTGMSVPVLQDFMNGVTSQIGVTVDDAMDTVVEHTTHVLGNEFLQAMVVDTLLELNPLATTTNNSLDTVIDFLATGTDSDGDDAPVMVMIPEPEVYLNALAAPLDFAWDVIEAAVVSLVDMNIRQLTEIPDDFMDMVDAFGDVINGISSSHSLSPYLTVYENPGDQDPSRIHVYDSNKPANDQAIMELTRNNGNLEYTYDDYGNDEGWMLSAKTVDFLSGNSTVSLPLSPRGWQFLF